MNDPTLCCAELDVLSRIELAVMMAAGQDTGERDAARDAVLKAQGGARVVEVMEFPRVFPRLKICPMLVALYVKICGSRAK